MKEDREEEIEELGEETQRQQMLIAQQITGKRGRGTGRTQERKPKNKQT